MPILPPKFWLPCSKLVTQITGKSFICFFENVPTGWANKSSNGGSVMVYHGRIRKNNFPEKETKVIESPKSSLDLTGVAVYEH